MKRHGLGQARAEESTPPLDVEFRLADRSAGLENSPLPKLKIYSVEAFLNGGQAFDMAFTATLFTHLARGANWRANFVIRGPLAVPSEPIDTFRHALLGLKIDPMACELLLPRLEHAVDAVLLSIVEYIQKNDDFNLQGRLEAICRERSVVL